MKKLYMIILCLIMVVPLPVFGYSDYIIPGGENIGIKVEASGVLVIGFYQVNNKYNNNGLRVGDYITHINNEEVNSVNDLINTIEQYKENESVNLTIRRDDKTKNVDFKLINVNGKIKTGLYVKDSLTGIGTLTFIDPETKKYGALGHEIIESETSKQLEIDTGKIFKSEVSSIDRSINGSPGTKNAKFYSSVEYGKISKNTNKGIYGEYNVLPDKKLMQVGKGEDLKTGHATIYTVTENNDVKEYSINITNIDLKSDRKNIYFEIDDKKLLEITGGIVQGMSGSPIIQDNKIFGAVTHVVTDNVKRGYGILITTMLEEGEK